MTDLPPDDDSARRVRETWNRLAQTPWRDFYVASHPGWDDPAAWAEQATIDVRFYLTGLGRDWLARQNVLEIGCGVGRLAGLLSGLTRSYTGIDISSAMLEEATKRCRALANARFFAGSGRDVPAAARDRSYGLILAVAVFIHCPRDLIEATVRSALPLLAPGGTFRMQLRVDPDDPEVATIDPAYLRAGAGDDREVTLPAFAPRQAAAAVPAEAIALAEHRDYGGHMFRVAEARSALAAWTSGARAELHRPSRDLLHAVLSPCSEALPQG